MAKYQKYAEYQDSGLEWLGGIPDHWEVKKLKYLGEAIIGLTYSPDDVVDNETVGTLVLRSSNVQNKKLAFDDNVYVRKEIPKKLRTQKDDILICARNGSRALIGKNALIDDSATGITFGAFMSIFRSPYNTYLSNVFNSALFEYQSGTFLTATINQLTTGNLNSFEVPFPPKAERDVIAHFLDHETAKIDSLIEKQQQLIQLLKEKRQAVISHAVTKGLDPNVKMKDSGVEWLGAVPEHWERKSLNYLIAHTVDNRGRTPPIVEEGIPMVEVSQVAGNGLYTSNSYSKFITQKSYEQFVRSDVQENDILFVTVGATFGKTCLVPPSPDFFIAQNIVGFRCVADVNPKFFMFLFSSSIFKEAVSATNKSSTIDNIKVSDLVKTRVAIPPYKEQKEIANHIFNIVDKYEKLVTKADSVISLLQERRTALISAAVTGKIDVRHWQNPHTGLGTKLNKAFKTAGLVNAGFTLPERPIE